MRLLGDKDVSTCMSLAFLQIGLMTISIVGVKVVMRFIQQETKTKQRV